MEVPSRRSPGWHSHARSPTSPRSLMGEPTSTNGAEPSVAEELRPHYGRVLLKLGGEMFGGGSGRARSRRRRPGRPADRRGGAQRRPGRRGDRRRQLLPRRPAAAARHGTHPLGLHGHARHGDEQPCAAGLPGEGRHRHPGADRHHHGSGRRALHPAARRAAPGEGPRGHLRRRHGTAVLLHRHHRRPARPGDRRRGGADGQGGRRRVHRRPAGEPRCRAAHRDHPPRGHRPRAAGRRCHRVQPVHGQRNADPGVQPADRRQYRPSGRG